jgi:aspartyl-tRNA(Asn)/glutamyl-tRNA(Gln) amidotransferase subunit B
VLFEAARAADAALSPKRLANWVSGEYLRLAKGDDPTVDATRISGTQLAALVRLVEDGHVSGTNAKEVLLRVARTGRPVAEVVAEAGFRQISDAAALQVAVDEVIAENPAAVADIRAGAQKAIGFLTGRVMQKTRGQADAGLVQQLIRSTLEVD